MPARKKTPTRDPKRDPYRSPHSDDERRHLDIPDLITEFARAVSKAAVAKNQHDAGALTPFAAPDLSEMSATATTMTLRPIVVALAEWGKQDEDRRSAGGKSRGQTRKDKAKEDAITIRNAATILLAHHAPHEITGILMARGHGGRDRILRALRGDTSTAAHWPPRKKQSHELSI